MPIKLPSFRARRDVYPADLWTKCPSCETMLFNKQLDKALRVCPTCGHHFRLSAATRLAQLLDPGPGRSATRACSRSIGSASSTRSPTRTGSRPPRPRPACAMRRSGGRAPSVAAGSPICVMDFGFMGGSMGAVVGEKVTRAAESALDSRLPLIVVSASGGARMQEGTLALMQLAKTLAALERLRAAGVPFLSVLSDPTTGGVFASFAVGRRRQHRRAGRPDRVRRIARLGGHDRPGAAGRLPALGVPVRPRVHRPGRRPSGAARRAGAPARLLPVRVPDAGAVNGPLDIETPGSGRSPS